MKRIGTALVTGALALTATIVSAQDAKTILKNHSEAVGGAAAWEQVKVLTKEGKMTVMGMDMPVKMTYFRDKGMRQDFSVMGSACYVIITPTAGWMFIPPQGHTKPEAMPADQLKDAAEELDFEDALLRASRKKYDVALLGKEDVDGASCFKLKITNDKQQEQTCYVDGKTWHLVKKTQVSNVQGQDMEVTTQYSNYTKLPSGIVVAFKEDGGDAGVMTYEKVVLNEASESVLKP